MTQEGEKSVERRASISREEFALVQTLFKERFDAHEKLDEQRFMAVEKIGLERHEALRLRLESVGQNVHNLRHDLTQVFALPDRMDAMEGDLKDVPRKQDLEYVTKTFTTQIVDLRESISKDKDDSHKRLTRTIAVISIAVTVILSAVSIVLKFL